MYRILTTAHLLRSTDGRFLHSHPCDATIVVAGVGGTGSYLAELVVQRAYAARHLYAAPNRPGWSCRLFLFDPDTVEARNVARQNFELADAGRAKVAALGERLMRRYAGSGLRVSANARRFGRDDLAAIAGGESSAQFWLFGCVDNPSGRRELHAACADLVLRRERPGDWAGGAWYVDSGNGFTTGQVALGNATCPRQLVGAFDRARGEVSALPVPTWDDPALVEAGAAAADEVEAYRRLDCATALELGFQDPGINGLVAQAAANLFFQGLIGRLYSRGARIDLDDCSMVPVRVEPREIGGRCGVPEEVLYAEEDAASESGRGLNRSTSRSAHPG